MSTDALTLMHSLRTISSVKGQTAKKGCEMMGFSHFIKKYAKPSKKGFSLVELIAVIAILAITSTAVLSVYLMVGKVTQDASDITIEQFNVGQTEKFIRHELAAASNINVITLENYQAERDIVPDDEYIMFDISDDDGALVTETSGTIRFIKYDEDGNEQSLYNISDVQRVEFSIVPVNEQEVTSGDNYKFFYNITTSHYTYSGGFVLSNTEIGSTEDESMNIGDEFIGGAQNIVWEAGGDYNDHVIFFHKELSVLKYIDEDSE